MAQKGAGHSRCTKTLQSSGVTIWKSGARGRDRTTDTAIFSRMLYQLSYPGIESNGQAAVQEARL